MNDYTMLSPVDDGNYWNKALCRGTMGIELSERLQGDKRLIFLINHLTDPLDIMLDQRYTDQLSGKIMEGNITILPRDILILAELV
jgi:hypothetical protein